MALTLQSIRGCPQHFGETGTRLSSAIHGRLLSQFFLREGGRLYTGYCGQGYENNVIATLYGDIYRLTNFEFTIFCVYYLLPDFYCLRLNPVEATEGRGRKIRDHVLGEQRSHGQIFWNF